jgi:hypothetical protein
MASTCEGVRVGRGRWWEVMGGGGRWWEVVGGVITTDNGAAHGGDEAGAWAHRA